jgi:hypothetical protein
MKGLVGYHLQKPVYAKMESFESDLMRLKDLPLVDDKPVMHVE